MNEVYRILSYLHLDEDVEQEIAILAWEKRNLYSSEKGALSTWINAIAKNYVISVSRSTSFKKENLTDPISKFEIIIEDGAIINTLDDKLTSAELSPIDYVIASEKREELLNRLDELPANYKDALLKKMNGYKVERNLLNRAKLYFSKGRKEKKYLLTNLTNGQEYMIDTLDEASKICGAKNKAIHLALQNNRPFQKKRWKISSF